MQKSFLSTSRITGLLYLGLAITGMLAFLFARSKLYVADDAVATTTNFITQSSLARFGIAAELALVVFQALVAVWFFKLFRSVNSFAALALCTFGSINAVVILVASAFWLGALHAVSTSNSVSLTPAEVGTAFMLFEMHESLWVVGKLFFGLWLIPMGYLAQAAKMPWQLGWIVMGGGIGYVLSLFMQILFPDISTAVLAVITIPATIGEFWMIGYLLFKKVGK